MILQMGQEGAWQKQAALGMLPSQEGLRADDAPGLESDLRLVVQHELARSGRRVQLGSHGQPG